MPLKVPNYTYTGTCPQTLLHFCQVHIRNGLAQDPATVLPYGSPLRLYEVSVQRYISDIYIYMYMYHMRPQSLNLKPQRSGQKKKPQLPKTGLEDASGQTPKRHSPIMDPSTLMRLAGPAQSRQRGGLGDVFGGPWVQF